MKCSNATARKFILSKQLLFSPRRIAGLNGIEVVFNSLRAIQYDPQSPCGGTVDLSLQARVSGIRPLDYYRWLYEQRKGVEAYDKELTVVPIEDLPLCRGVFPGARRRKLEEFLRVNAKELKDLLRQIEKNGQICSSDISESKKVDIFWEPTRWSKVALDSLWKTGKLVIARRQNGRKYYDLPRRVYGDDFVWRSRICEKKLQDECVVRRLKSVGMLPISGTGSGWQGIGSGSEIKAVLLKLIKQGRLIEVETDGIKNHYVVNSSDSEMLLSIEKEETDEKVSFLSPLDNLLWDRKMVKDIFGFDYVWETYTPVNQRRFGHYVLPILYGSEFIGRIEPRHDKKENRLDIRGLWVEHGFTWKKDVRRSFWRYLGEFQDYLGSRDVKWLCKAPPK